MLDMVMVHAAPPGRLRRDLEVVEEHGEYFEGGKVGAVFGNYA